MATKVLVRSEILNVVSVYAPQIRLSDDIKKQFWEDLDSVIQNVPRSKKLFIGGDFNGHIDEGPDGYDTAHGGFGYGERNNGRVAVLDFAVAYELLVVNSYFKKKEDHLIIFKSGSLKTQIDYFLIRADSRRLCKDCKVIFKSGSLKTQIDYFLIRADNRRLCKDCKVIPSEYLGSQHRLLVLDVEF